MTYAIDQFTIDHWCEYATHAMLTAEEIRRGIDILMQGGDEAQGFVDVGWRTLEREVSDPALTGWDRVQMSRT